MSMIHKSGRYTYKLARDEVAAGIGLSEIDNDLLIIYKNLWKLPKTAVLHQMIGIAAKCFEEKHVETIRKLEEQNQTLTRMVFAYIKKYGKISRKDLAVGETERKMAEKGQLVEKEQTSEQELGLS